MIVLYVLLGLVGLLLLLMLAPVHLKAAYDGALRVSVRYLFVTVRLYPRPAAPSKKEKRVIKKAAGKKSAPETDTLSGWEALLREEGPSGVVRAVAELAKLAGTAARRLLAAITVDRLVLRLVVACGDAAETAVGYGRACAALYPSLAVLESVVRVRRRDIAVAPDFLRQEGEVRGEIRLHALPLRILWTGLRLAAAYLGNTFKQQINKQEERG